MTETVNDESLSPTQKLQELIRLAENCVDLVQENNDFYAEVRNFITTERVLLSSSEY